MQQVTLRIPKDHQLHSWWHDCDEFQTAHALNVAGSIMSLTCLKERKESVPVNSNSVIVGGASTAETPTTPLSAKDITCLLSSTVACEIVENKQYLLMTLAEACQRVLIVIKHAEILRSKPDVDEFHKLIYSGAENADAALFVSLKGEDSKSSRKLSCDNFANPSLKACSRGLTFISMPYGGATGIVYYTRTSERCHSGKYGRCR